MWFKPVPEHFPRFKTQVRATLREKVAELQEIISRFAYIPLPERIHKLPKRFEPVQRPFVGDQLQPGLHGDCCLILSQENEAVLVDCGYNSTTGWKPSEGLAKQGFGSRRRLHHLILTHPDQDHLADLPGVIEKLKPVNVWQHPQLTLRNISELKVTLSKAQEAYLAKKKTASELQPIEVSKNFQTMQLRQFYLPIGSVRDANDLSLVTFLSEDRFTVCFPGDLTARGWKLHLENKAFQYMLRETNLFVASHHGRPTGFYEPVYEFLYPKLIVISDKEQEKGRKVIQRVPYRDHAYGVKLADGSFRKVLTTRGDGRIRINVKDRVWEVSTSRTSKPKED